MGKGRNKGKQQESLVLDYSYQVSCQAPAYETVSSFAKSIVSRASYDVEDLPNCQIQLTHCQKYFVSKAAHKTSKERHYLKLSLVKPYDNVLEIPQVWSWDGISDKNNAKHYTLAKVRNLTFLQKYLKIISNSRFYFGASNA